VIQTRSPASEKDADSLIYDQEYIDLDKLVSILYKETIRLGGKLQKISERSKEYNQSLSHLTKLLGLLVDLIKVHKPANIKEQEDILGLLNRLKELKQTGTLSKNVEKTVEETIKFARKRKVAGRKYT